MRKSLFVLVACCSLSVVCAIGNSGWVVDSRQEFGEDGHVREIIDDTASNDTLVNAQERENSVGVRQENFDLVEAPMIPYQHVHVLKACCSLAYARPLELEREGSVKLFYRGTNDTDEFAGFIKEVGYNVDDDSGRINTLVVSFPGTRGGGTLKESIGDIFTDLWAFGEDGGFVNSLQREGVAVHSSFAEEVMCFYASMLRAIKSYINEKVKEIHFTGHSKGGGEAILAALRFASDIKRDIGANNSVFQYVFGNEAQEVFSLFRSVFGRDNAIKVFTFSAPAVINKNGKDLFYEVIGRKNVVCIFKNLDIVPDLPYLAGKGLRPIGIQANISKGSELGYQEEVNRIVESCEEGVWMVTSEFVKNFVMKSHKLDGFNEDLIWMIMRRIEGNYENDPNMDENIMGIDRKPILRKLMIWKQ